MAAGDVGRIASRKGNRRLDTFWDDVGNELSDAYHGLLGFAVDIVEAIVVLAIAVVVARFVRKRLRERLTRSAISPNVVALIANGVTIVVYVLGASLVLGVFGANWTALLTVLSVGTLALSLAMQDVLKNFVSGVYILVERPFVIGDRIRVRDFEGRVEGIEIRTTVLRNRRAERVLVPNAIIFSEIIVNRSFYRTPHLTIGLKGVEASLDGLEEAVRDALADVPRLQPPSPQLSIRATGSQGTDIDVNLWHEPQASVELPVIARLRALFPEATISTQS